jgi:hypothetical protein
MTTPSTPDRPYPAADPPVEQTLILGEPATESDATTAAPTTSEATTSEATMSEPATEAPVTAPAPAASGTESDIAPGAEFVVRRGIRMRTVVFGLVLLAVAGSVLIAQLTDVTIDAGAVFLALMIGGGVLLIAGARRS